MSSLISITKFIDFNALKLNASLKSHEDNKSKAQKEYHTETLENDVQYDDTTGIYTTDLGQPSKPWQLTPVNHDDCSQSRNFHTRPTVPRA